MARRRDLPLDVPPVVVEDRLERRHKAVSAQWVAATAAAAAAAVAPNAKKAAASIPKPKRAKKEYACCDTCKNRGEKLNRGMSTPCCLHCAPDVLAAFMRCPRCVRLTRRAYRMTVRRFLRR